MPRSHMMTKRTTIVVSTPTSARTNVASSVPAVVRRTRSAFWRSEFWAGGRPDEEASLFGQTPIPFEHLREFADDRWLADDDAHLASFVQFELAEALTSDERAAAIAHDRAHV